MRKLPRDKQNKTKTSGNEQKKVKLNYWIRKGERLIVPKYTHHLPISSAVAVHFFSITSAKGRRYFHIDAAGYWGDREWKQTLEGTGKPILKMGKPILLFKRLGVGQEANLSTLFEENKII